MPPRRPQGGLGDNNLLGDRHALSSACVLELTPRDNVHLGLARQLAFAEDHVAGRKQQRRHREVADPSDDLWRVRACLGEEMMQTERREVHLEVHLDAQRLRHHWQQLDDICRQVCGQRVLGAALHPESKVAGDRILLQILAEHEKLARPGAVNDVKLRQLRGQEADHERARDECEDPNADGEEPFHRRAWCDLVHPPGKL
mmetsp:Transcript_43465/g.125636  ORF Transcript_43465/g.125636 Transcript_43465/m.125636 type:complete len:201 (-) Transcript_43465:1799-2401(-)